MKTASLLLTALLLSACGTKTVTDPKIVAAQASADAAAARYAGCVDRAAKALDPAADQPATLTDLALKACRGERATTVAKVLAAELSRGGDDVIAREIAERSVRVADSELRERANATIVTRKYEKAS